MGKVYLLITWAVLSMAVRFMLAENPENVKFSEKAALVLHCVLIAIIIFTSHVSTLTASSSAVIKTHGTSFTSASTGDAWS